MTNESIELKVNKAFIPFMENSHRNAISYGGPCSGKSYAAATKLVMRCLTETDNGKFDHHFLAVRKDYSNIKRSIYSVLKHVCHQMGIDVLVKFDMLNMQFSFFNGATITCVDYNYFVDRPILGATGIWYEEATEFTEKEFELMDGRLKLDSPYYVQSILTFNPQSIFTNDPQKKMDWIYAKFFVNLNEDTDFIIRTSITDNDFINQCDIDSFNNYLKPDSQDFHNFLLGDWNTKN